MFIDSLRPYVAVNVLVIMSEDIEEKFFKDFKGKIIKWNIEDCSENNLEDIKRMFLLRLRKRLRVLLQKSIINLKNASSIVTLCTGGTMVLRPPAERIFGSSILPRCLGK